jgi:hypothetical protein
MTRARRPLLAGIPVVILAGALALAAGPSSAAKKGGGKAFSETKQVNAAVPDWTGTPPATPLQSQIKVPKKFKKKVVGDVNVTLQTTGLSGTEPADDLFFSLTAPNGRTVRLFAGGGFSIGPLTMDDDTPTLMCNSTIPECGDPHATLVQPFAGTASGGTDGEAFYFNLWRFNGVKMRGSWTFTIFDQDAGETSLLNSWGLRVKPAKPVAE